MALPPPLSFSHLPLPPAVQSPTVFLSASCLEVNPRVSLRLVNLSAAERLKGRLLAQEGQEHLHPDGALFFSRSGPTVVVSGTSSLEPRPAWEDAEGRGAQLSP